VNASVFFSAAVFCWLSDPLNEHVYGRRGALFVAAIFSFSSVIGAAYASTLASLLACRVLLGVGMAAKASVVPILAAETAPRSIRGSLVIAWQLLDSCGICLGFAANLAVFPSWRRMVAAPFIPALAVLILVPLCTESPRWLLKKGRYKEALKAWIRLRGVPTPILACRDLYYTHVQIQSETRYLMSSQRGQEIPLESVTDGVVRDGDDYQEGFKLTSYRTRLVQLVRIPRIRRAAVSAFVVMVAQQACGVGTIYSSHISLTTLMFLNFINLLPVLFLSGAWLIWNLWDRSTY
jgi:MFS family permease